MANTLPHIPEFPDASKLEAKVLGHPKLGDKKGAKFSLVPIIAPATQADVAPAAVAPLETFIS